MKNGIQSNSLKIIISLLFLIFLNSITAANEIQISPLINLDEIAPTFEDLDEENFPQKKREEIKSETADSPVKLKSVTLSALNKITARVDRFELSIKENFIYEDLRIYPIHCSVSDSSQKQETSVYLKIYNNLDNSIIFSGWMLKTLPSISSMEHTLYDIWVNECS